MTNIHRFVDIPSDADDCNLEPRVKEHFVGFGILHHSSSVTGDAITGRKHVWSTSTRRWEVLKRHVPNLTVKPLSDTRWENHISSLKALRYQLGSIFDALIEISGNSSRVEARGHFKFNVFLVVWNDEEYVKAIVNVKELEEELDISAEFESELVHIRRRKKQITYEGDDEPIQNPKQKLKCIPTRHSDRQCSKCSYCSVSPQDILTDSVPNVVIVVSSPQDILTDSVPNVVIVVSPPQDILTDSVPNVVIVVSPPQDILTDSVPNVLIALRILLTLPVSVASGWKSFSKLKLIKTYLRSTMTQERLVGLSTLSIEHEMAEKLDLKQLVRTSARKKARKVKF
ncbi:uncharacterized protein LOC106472490 [Limulus polyphemus]|uniref:Uncharacterized protein LOC106472490 n=1 Tax=Limulus polyphemus TaxID=6850 RepID=A0ABM1BTY8_LIMPO|nr:uncharacterized protein LOC106472490 [Limulus polyphemus]